MDYLIYLFKQLLGKKRGRRERESVGVTETIKEILGSRGRTRFVCAVWQLKKETASEGSGEGC